MVVIACPPFRFVRVEGKRNGELAGNGTWEGRPAPWDTLSQSRHNKMRLYDIKPHKRIN